MSVLNKWVAAIVPHETDQARIDARSTAQAIAERTPWLALVLAHHQRIEAEFSNIVDANTAAARHAGLRRLTEVVTGHDLAEESVLYPAMALADQKAHSGEAYVEQAATKVQFAALGDMDAMSSEFLVTLERVREALAHHI